MMRYIPDAKLIFVLYTIYQILNMVFPMNLGSNRDAIPERIYPQVCMGAINIYCIIYTFLNIRSLISNKYLSVFVIYFVYIFFYSFLPSMMGINLIGRLLYFMKISIALSMMFCLYLSVLEEENNERYIYMIFYVAVIYGFWGLYREIQYVHLTSGEIIDANAGFILASCIPMTFVIPQERLRTYLYAVIACATLVSGQRAAALGVFISLPLAIKYIKSNLKWPDYFLFGFVFVIVAYPIIDKAIMNLEARHIADIKRGNSYGSGRTIFWTHIWKDFCSSNLLQQLFGHLNDSIPALLMRKMHADINAHNGWLQNLHTYGMVGLFLYIKCYIQMVKTDKFINSILPDYKNVVLLMFFIFAMRSSASHGEFDISYIPFCLAYTLLLAKGNRSFSMV